MENRNEVSQAGDISAEMDEDNQADVLLLNEPNIQVHNEGINIPDMIQIMNQTLIVVVKIKMKYLIWSLNIKCKDENFSIGS